MTYEQHSRTIRKKVKDENGIYIKTEDGKYVYELVEVIYYVITPDIKGNVLQYKDDYYTYSESIDSPTLDILENLEEVSLETALERIKQLEESNDFL